jgi:predicted Zn-dependent peptidase
MVLSAAGNVDHGTLVRLAEELFQGLNPGRASAPAPARYVGGSRTSDKSFEQAHVVLGFEGVTFRDPDYYAAQVFSGLFGGGMSSRLFQQVREKRGLCYSIYSSSWGLADTGLFSIHAATGPDIIDELVEVVRRELAVAADELVSERELQRSKAQLKTGLLMSLESSVGRAEQMARQILAFDRLVPAEELIEKVEAVTRERVRETVNRIVRSAPPSIALVGAGRKASSVASRAMERIGT